MTDDLIVCQILIYCLGLIIGFLTQLLYPFFFLVVGSLIAGILIKHTHKLIDEQKGSEKVEIRIR
jgi:hypothetical protein